ncbi:cilia- and flagella-associated protein 44 isoform X3 [Hypanus sabinus]|uniref:cilia- and flagella-associated protein 44 isoform X3 n=1 Tax=Hypanus sabinus TaxID=79690 RepID=UPI0028C4C77E|nr:cilia- and flagella-associated protein 44 isoform X3 [Hypanus sabinus]
MDTEEGNEQEMSSQVPDSDAPADDQKDENSEYNVPEDETASAEEKEQPAEKQERKEAKKTEERILLDDFFYDYEELCSKPFISPKTSIPNNLLTFLHSFGYDSTRQVNLQLIGGETIMFVAGNLVIFMNIKTKDQKYIRSASGGGIGILMVHPNGNYFAVGEKGIKPNIIIYEYPSLKPYRNLRGGTERGYAFVDFNPSGNLLVSVGENPDYMVTIWNWKQEQIVLRSKAFSQDVYRITFSLENEEQLTSSGTGHIKFWKMVETFTGLKLQGELGRFGKTALTDIVGYVELPDGKVISGCEWGNMLLWDGGLIKVELRRKGGKPCHQGSINQFVLDEGELITIGSDGCVRVWDFETIDTAEAYDEYSVVEMEPMNELFVGRNVNLQSMVKFKDSSFIWCAQDSSGRIWKLDLSFSNITQDPECLFSFHAGVIQAMDLSPLTYLMATTALDHTVRIYDFVRNEELITVRYRRGGTALTWAPLVCYPEGNIIVVGFDDGVIRILEIYNPQDLARVAGQTQVGEAEVRLKQAMKPHTAQVTAIAFDRNGEMLATGSKDSTVFFFQPGDQYVPVGFINIPGPVVSLQWSPPFHEKNTLLILCENGYVVQVARPESEEIDTTLTFEIPLQKQYFHFKSIRSSIERNKEINRRKEVKEQKEKEKQERLKKQKEMEEENQGLAIEEEEEEEEEEELPMIYIPIQPSPILCGFYSKPNTFWLSMGDYDCGYLYHCKFADDQRTSEDSSKSEEEPFAFIAIEDATENPIRKMIFNSEKDLLFCGMEDGALRVYPLKPNDYKLKSMQGFWSLNVHDNDYGHINQICISHNEQFLLTCGADSNIFAFAILPQEELGQLMRGKRALVPIPRPGFARDKVVNDIDDPNAYSLENAKQKAEMDLILKLAEEKKAKKRMEIDFLQNEFKELQIKNAELPEHVQLKKEDFEIDRRIQDQIDKQITDRIEMVYKKMAWEQEKYQIGLQKLQARFRDAVEYDTVIVHCFESDHKVSTYRVTSFSKEYHQMKADMLRKGQLQVEQKSKDNAFKESKGTDIDKNADQDVDIDMLGESKHRQAKVITGLQHAERLQNIINKTDNAKAKIEQRKKEWTELFLSQPDDNYEDPNDVAAIKDAQEQMGDFKLKTASNYTVPEHLRINAEKKRNQLIYLEELINELIKNFDAELLVLCHQKYRLDIVLKMADLRHITLFEEVLLLKEFEKSENILQDRVDQRITERVETQLKLEECSQQKMAKKRDILKLQEKEKAIYASFQMSLGENNKHADFLTKVFKKKIKRRKKSEAQVSAVSDEESEEESDEEFGYSDEGDESDSDDGGVDDSVCPDTCDPALFENTLQLREKRLDIEETIAEEKKTQDSIKKEYDLIAKKVKAIDGTVKSAKRDLEVLQREKQQKLNELYVVVPLKLHQIEYIVNGDMPNDLVSGLVFTSVALTSLQNRIKELHVETTEQRELYKQARQKHVQLLQDKAKMEAEIAELEEKCYQEMVRKFGRVVDLEALQTLSVNITLEELKEKIDVNNTKFHRKIKQREEKRAEMQDELISYIRQYTCRLDQLNMMLTEKEKIEAQLNSQQKKMGTEIQKQKVTLSEKHELIQQVEKQAQEINDLKEEINLLTRKGGHILPPAQPPLPQ